MPNNVNPSSPVNVNYDSRIERVDEETILDAIFKRLRDIEQKVDDVKAHIFKDVDSDIISNENVLFEVIYKALRMHTQLDDITKKEVASSISLLMRSNDEPK